MRQGGSGIGTRVTFTPDVCGDCRAHRQSDRARAADLLGLFDRVLGQLCSFGEVAPPHLDQRAVTGHRHHVDFGATVDTSQPDGLHDGAGLVQFAGPSKQ